MTKQPPLPIPSAFLARFVFELGTSCALYAAGPVSDSRL